jgi:hypothetical protein
VQVARPAIVNAKELFTIRNEVGLYWPFTPKPYFAAIDAHGSPLNIRRDLELAVPPAREQADMVLVRVESIFVTSRVHIGSVRPRAASGRRSCPPGRRAP